ncbi:hypothetical protein QF042_005187 [Pedobacter sp. W3I1]|nr:hypothetical protein [Pedobacter sp. W3I1]
MTGFKEINHHRLSSLREGFFSRRSNLYGKDHCRKDCFVVPSRNDDLSNKSVNDNPVEGPVKYLSRRFDELNVTNSNGITTYDTTT